MKSTLKPRGAGRTCTGPAGTEVAMRSLLRVTRWVKVDWTQKKGRPCARGGGPYIRRGRESGTTNKGGPSVRAGRSKGCRGTSRVGGGWDTRQAVPSATLEGDEGESSARSKLSKWGTSKNSELRGRQPPISNQQKRGKERLGQGERREREKRTVY